MNLITEAQRAQLLANGRQSIDNDDFDPPVVKLFTPDAGATWLLTEINPDDHDHAFGLCDLGQGFPELGMRAWPSCNRYMADLVFRSNGICTSLLRSRSVPMHV